MCLVLKQGTPNLFVRGPHQVIQNMSRARHLMKCNCCGICYILPNQHFFVSTVYYIFSSSTKWLRGPDEMASRAAPGPRAVIWRRLVLEHYLFIYRGSSVIGSTLIRLFGNVILYKQFNAETAFTWERGHKERG